MAVKKPILQKAVPKSLILATNNRGKLLELQAPLSALNIDIKTQPDYGLDSVEETGQTFIENALLKARMASQKTGLPAIADDSGLLVEALQGAPGLYSARYAGAQATDVENYEALLKAMKDVSQDKRQAHYYCCIVFLQNACDPTPVICEGRWYGHILLSPQGEGGFGYDPVFFVPEYQCSAAQLKPSQKNRISHRAQAIMNLVTYFQDAQNQ